MRLAGTVARDSSSVSDRTWPGNKQIMSSAVVRDRSVSVNITWPDCVIKHLKTAHARSIDRKKNYVAGLAEYTHMEFPAVHASCVNYAKHITPIFSMLKFHEMREASICNGHGKVSRPR